MLIKEGTTTDAYQTATVHPLGKKLNLVLKNKHASNIITAKVFGYVTEGDTDSGVQLRAEGDLAGTIAEELEVTKVYEEVVVSVKTKTSPNHAGFEIHAAISKVGV